MEDMLLFIKKYPEMVLDAIYATKNTKLPNYTAGEDYDKILVCGMGGSAIGGDLLRNLLRDFMGQSSEFGLPIESIEVSRQYGLPSNVGKRTLVFFVSYSGNTEETLNQFVEARKTGCKIISITSGGVLKEWSEHLGVPVIELPHGFQPRAAIPYLFVPMVRYVAGDRLKKEFDEAIEVLKTIRDDEKKAETIKKMAMLMKNHWITIYGPAEFEAVARRAKTQINENSKLPATWGIFPELCHNDIVGYEDNDLNKELYVVFLRDSFVEKHKPAKVRIETIKEIIRPCVKGVAEIHSVGESKLARMFSLLYYVDLLSYYLAVEDKKSPVKTDNIDKLKAVLREKVNLQAKLKKELI